MSSNEPLLALKHTNCNQPCPDLHPKSDEQLTLSVHTASRPQIIQHAPSQQSFSASEDYYTVSSEISTASDLSDDRSQVTIVRHTTPPDAYHTPLASPDPLTTVHEQRPSQDSTATAVHPKVSFSESTITRKPVASTPRPSGSQCRSIMDSESLSTTPGVDDTPYIRFAIDQLTRDEEVRGTRIYPVNDHEYPVDRIVSDEGLGYVHPGHPITADVRNPARPPPMQPLDVQRDIFVPCTPSFDAVQYPPLNFLPGILRPAWLGLFILLCVLMVVGMIVSAIWSSDHQGLLDYVNLGDSRYFLFQYFPPLLGMVFLMWLHQIAAALQRLSPFMALASDSSKTRSEGVFLDLYPTQFMLPTFQHFKSGQYTFGVFFFVCWMFLFTIPLLGSSFNVRFHGPVSDGQFRWVAAQGVIWTAITLYLLLIISLILVCWVLRQPTGLKWDARCLADIVVLLERSNNMADYKDSEVFTSIQEFRETLANRTDRLGYWHTSKRPSDIFYGLGEPGGALRKYVIGEKGKITEKHTLPGLSNPTEVDVEAARHAGDIRMDIREEEVRRAYVPWFLKDTFVVAWIVVAVILLLVFLAVSFANKAVVNGFKPLVSVATNSGGFSSSNFLYSFLPVVLAMILYLAIQTLDLTLRRLHPFAMLSNPGGSPADVSLLLDYPARLPINVTIVAFLNKHYRVAGLSLASLITAFTLPVLASGIFWTQFYRDTGSIRVAAHPAAYYSLCAFLCLYGMALALIFPQRYSMATPHESRNLAQIISWLYQSRIVNDPAFSRPRTKAELCTRLCGPRVYGEQGQNWVGSLRSLFTPSKQALHAQYRQQGESTVGFAVNGESSSQQPSGSREYGEKRRVSLVDPGSVRYGFGIHYGRDGNEHLGIDRVQRGEGRMMHFD
ncbi:uncharacterized protein IWZ02DRAFT_436337 [Phyllosticta citriasiana]|uniref:uncharacterized protein n=1 Tax=Phyllosticta citriasiana TaxID=595635 RepID=UPI0030FD7FF2